MNNNRKNRNILTHETKNIVRGERLNNRDFIWKIITVIVLLEIILIAPVVSSFTNTAIIKSTGQISANTIVARSGSPQDIQAAVDSMAAAGVGTVYVPSGVFNWNGESVYIPAGVSVIGAGQNNTILQQAKSAPFPDMFSIEGTGQSGRPVRISGITFKGKVTGDDNVAGVAIYVENVIDYRIDHCDFIDFPNVAIVVMGNSGCRGVIDHCNIKCLYKDTIGGSWGYGVVVSSVNYWDWDDDITHFLGKYETIPTLFPIAYIEDCYFYKCRHAVASNQLGWYVFRYNTVYQEWNSAVDVHGSSPTGAGGRGGEVYNNYIIAPIGVGFRGGSGVIFNNTGGSPIWVMKDIEGTPLRPLNKLWIWSNDGEFVNYDGYYKENVNYFLRAPNQQQDGFTYTPYPYPHPLTLG
jgi:hypothetical protein